MAKKKTENRHYVNNKEFLAAMTEYRTARVAAEEAGETPPRVSNYIGECFVKIANHLAYKSNFVNYTFREEMILDGIENCITYINNFDPAKSSNPFAYFTQITYYAFLRRIQKEKKQQHIRHKVIENMNVDILAVGEDMAQAQFVEYLQKNFLPAEDVYKPKKKKKTEPKGLEKFYDEDSADN